MNRSTITKRVAEDKGSDSVELQLLSCILEKLRPETARQLTDGMLERICPTIGGSALRRSMVYLCSERVGLFEMAFAVFDDDGDQHDLAPSEVRRLLSHGSATHPATGEDLSLEGDHAPFIFFKGTAVLVAVLGNG